MAAAVFMSDPLVLRDLRECGITEDEKYLEKVSKFVSAHRSKPLVLQNPRDAVLEFVELDDTIYREKPDQDKKVYAYDGEELHLVASSLQHLFKEGMDYPASKSYYNGEAFKDMTERDWAEVKKGAVWKSLERDHRKLAESKKSSFLENLKSQK